MAIPCQRFCPEKAIIWRDVPLRTSSFAQGCGGRVGRHCGAAPKDDPVRLRRQGRDAGVPGLVRGVGVVRVGGKGALQN
jgi:hypothetical protein